MKKTFLSILLPLSTLAVAQDDFQGVQLPGIPIQPVEQSSSQGAAGARPRNPLLRPEADDNGRDIASMSRTDRAAFLKPVDLKVAPGVTELITIGKGRLNRIIVPFSDPVVKTADDVTSETDQHIVYVASETDVPIGMFIHERGQTTPAISVTLIPRAIPPREIRLSFDTSVPGAGYANYVPRTKAKAWEEEQPYVSTQKRLIRAIAMGEIPSGYSLRRPRADEAVQFYCDFQFLDGDLVQVIEGHHFKTGVVRVRNVSNQMVEINERRCLAPGVRTVAAFPTPMLEPSQEVELYIVRVKADPSQKPPARPYVFSQNRKLR